MEALLAGVASGIRASSAGAPGDRAVNAMPPDCKLTLEESVQTKETFEELTVSCDNTAAPEPAANASAIPTPSFSAEERRVQYAAALMQRVQPADCSISGKGGALFVNLVVFQKKSVNQIGGGADGTG